MNITIKRHQKSPDFIVGQLLIDGEHICHTLENPNSCLPAGSYPITLLKCKQYKRKMLVLSPVEGLCLEGTTRETSVTGGEALGQRTESKIWLEASTRCDHCPKLEFVCHNTTMPIYCPMLKPGNGVYNRLDGSILVGDCEVPGCILHPRTTFEALYQRIRKSIERGNQVVLTIKNEFV